MGETIMDNAITKCKKYRVHNGIWYKAIEFTRTNCDTPCIDWKMMSRDELEAAKPWDKL
jgi:hypothetical protein